MEEFYLVLKENKKNFMNKIEIFVDSEFVKTCQEHVENLVFVLPKDQDLRLVVSCAVSSRKYRAHNWVRNSEVRFLCI
jgi:hypothetical protein